MGIWRIFRLGRKAGNRLAGEHSQQSRAIVASPSRWHQVLDVEKKRHQIFLGALENDMKSDTTDDHNSRKETRYTETEIGCCGPKAARSGSSSVIVDHDRIVPLTRRPGLTRGRRLGRFGSLGRRLCANAVSAAMFKNVRRGPDLDLDLLQWLLMLGFAERRGLLILGPDSGRRLFTLALGLQPQVSDRPAGDISAVLTLNSGFSSSSSSSSSTIIETGL